MKLAVNEEFILICKQLLDKEKKETRWAEIESDDMFQSDSFVGGYDADEEAFCFSYYDEADKEYWFQVTLPQVVEIARGKRIDLEIRPAEE